MFKISITIYVGAIITLASVPDVEVAPFPNTGEDTSYIYEPKMQRSMLLVSTSSLNNNYISYVLTAFQCRKSNTLTN